MTILALFFKKFLRPNNFLALDSLCSRRLCPLVMLVRTTSHEHKRRHPLSQSPKASILSSLIYDGAFLYLRLTGFIFSTGYSLGFIIIFQLGHLAIGVVFVLTALRPRTRNRFERDPS